MSYLKIWFWWPEALLKILWVPLLVFQDSVWLAGGSAQIWVGYLVFAFYVFWLLVGGLTRRVLVGRVLSL